MGGGGGGETKPDLHFYMDPSSCRVEIQMDGATMSGKRAILEALKDQT